MPVPGAPVPHALAGVAAALSNPGLGQDVSQQLKDQLAERRKKLLDIGSDKDPNAYGANPSQGLGPVASLFGGMR